MTQIAVPIARIAATTATFPVRSSAAVAGTAAGILSWQRLLFASSPLSPEARRVRRQYRELTAGTDRTAGPQAVAHLGDRRDASGKRRPVQPTRAG
jgi:hypothetical protein